MTDNYSVITSEYIMELAEQFEIFNANYLICKNVLVSSSLSVLHSEVYS